MSSQNNAKTNDDNPNETEERYSDYKISSVEDAIHMHFTPEQRRNWIEFIVSNDNHSKEKELSPSSNQTKKEDSLRVSDNINRKFTKEERKKLAEMALGSDEDNEQNGQQSGQSSSTQSSDQSSQTSEKSKGTSLLGFEPPAKEEEHTNLRSPSVEDNILHHFTPEEKRKWTEFIAGADQELVDSKKQTPVSSKIEWKYSKKESLISVDIKEKVKNMSNDLLSHKIIIRKQMTKSTFGFIANGMYRNHKQIVIKVIDLNKSQNKGLNGNLLALKQLKHNNIINILDVINLKDVVFVVMPLAETDLYEYLSRRNTLNERTAKVIIIQIISGLQFIHSKGLAHRDVKLENCLLIGPYVKICDFDLMTCAVDRKGKSVAVSERVGTLVYMAPELLSGMGSPDLRMSDVWSFGILSFAALTYSYAFGSIEEIGIQLENVLKNMRYKRYSYPKQCYLSNDCKNFIERLLQFDPYSRPTMDQLLIDSWFSW